MDADERMDDSERERLKTEYVSGPRQPYFCADCGEQTGWGSPKQQVVWWSHWCPKYTSMDATEEEIESHLAILRSAIARRYDAPRYEPW